MSVLAEGFEERVGGIVVALPWLVDGGDGGAGHEEEVEGWVREGIVKVPCTVYFGHIHCDPFFVAHADDWVVLPFGLVRLLLFGY